MIIPYIYGLFHWCIWVWRVLDLLGHQAGGVPMGRLLTATPNEEEDGFIWDNHKCLWFNGDIMDYPHLGGNGGEY